MRRSWRRLFGTLALLALAAFFAPQAMAADHLDAPATQGDPAADINDLYVFQSTDSENTSIERTVLVMTVHPIAGDASRFSDAVNYNFHVRDSDSGVVYMIKCTADASTIQSITCTDGSISDVTAFNDEADGNRTGGQDLIAYAGLRDDPFFFDLEAFNSVYQSVLDGDPAPGPLLDDVGTDFFAGLGVLAIVVDLRNSTVLGDGTNFTVWADTVRIGQ